MTDKIITEKLISLLESYLKELEGVKLPYGEYVKDIKTQRFVERTLQISIEACIDIGNHIIASEKLGIANNNREIFENLYKNNIISHSTLIHFTQKIVGFRNILVHGYTRIDPEIVFGTLKKLSHIKKYKDEIIRFLKN